MKGFVVRQVLKAFNKFFLHDSQYANYNQESAFIFQHYINQDINHNCMLKQAFTAKTVAIIGLHTLTAKIIIKKLLRLADINLVLIDTAKQSMKVSQFKNDAYFSTEEYVLFEEKVKILGLNQLQKDVNSIGKGIIDMLFITFQGLDFSNEDKLVQCHLLRTSTIIAALSKIKITKCILLSSVYLKDPGYVGEDDEFEDAVIPARFQSKAQAHKYLKDNFDQPIDAWKWTIDYVQKSYMNVSQQIAIVRVPSLGPTIINHEGYSLHLNNLAYLICQVGLGKITSLDGIKSNKIDIVPNDFASNLMIVLAARNQLLKAQVINLTTNTRNYITLQQFIDISQEAWRQYGEKPAKIRIVETEWGQRLKHKSQKFPSEVKKRLGTMLDIVSWKIQGQRQSLEQDQKITIINKYKYFLCNEWLCESIKTIDLYNQIDVEDQQLLDFNVNHINWKTYVKLCVFSMKKYIMNQRVEQFKPQSLDMLGNHSEESYFSDITWALRQGKPTIGQPRTDAVQFVLNSKSVKDAIKNIVEENMLKLQNPPTSYEKAEEELAKVAEEICVTMFSDYSMKSIRLFAWFLHKLFGTIYQKVVVDKSDIAKIQSHNESSGPLIIIPTHRSYIDFLIISYVFFGYNIKCPHIAAAEDFLGMAVVHILLRRSGAFFIKRNQKKHKELYKAILNEYLSKLMLGNNYIEFFIEGTRSRTGKMLAPKFGVLSVVAQNVAEGRIRDAFILPVTINYQKVLEGNSFTYEMMGQAKVKESLSRVLKAVDVLKQNYGRIHIQFCNSISVRDWLSQHQGKFQQKVASMGVKIVQEMSKKLVISGPAIIASIVLMNRKGISDDSLQEQTTWLSKQISSRGIKITRSQPDSSISVNSTLGLLEGIVSKSKKDMFEVEVSFDQNSFVKLFTLTYYRNTLTHIFFEEAVIATALASFGYKAITEKGVTKDQLYNRTIFLWNLLSGQFYLTETLNNPARYEHLISFMMGKSIFRIQNGSIIGVNLEGHYFNFYWSLIWPIVESYWVTCLYLFKLHKTSTSIPLSKLYTQIQWFAQSLINDRVTSYLESISSDTIKNAITIFMNMKLIAGVKQQIGGETISAVKLAVSEEQLRKLLSKIEMYLKSSYGRSIKGVLESKHGTVNIDFPFLSRL